MFLFFLFFFLSSFLLFRTKYVWYLMAFWCIFYEGFNVKLWDDEFIEFSYGVFMYDSFDPCCDDDEEVYFPSVVLEVVN